ncbi:MAG TPA: FAD-dependent oxidoreductase, partial [Armatimonadota bacterium]|nr:FAD-dependent oxidoreductase [Armatimonadota bacterium]
DIPKMDGTDGKQVTKFVLEGRRLLREFYLQQHDNGGMTSRENLFPLTLPNMAQFRTTRRIVGTTTLTDNQHGRHVDDSVGLVADWRKPGFIWEIPYSTLVPQGVRGLLAAGRCISSEGDAWEVTRVIPAAALTGEIAGIAATLAVARKTTPDNITAKDVQRVLVTKGIPYHITDVLAASV